MMSKVMVGTIARSMASDSCRWLGRKGFQVLGDKVRSIFEDGEDGREGQGQVERHGDGGGLGVAEVENEELHPDSE